MINCLSEYLFSFTMSFRLISLFSSFSIPSCKWVGIRRPFCLIRNVDLYNMCSHHLIFFYFPILMQCCLKFYFTHCFISGFESSVFCMLNICYCYDFSCINFITLIDKRFFPIMFAFWSSIKINGADCIVHPPDSIAIINFPLGRTNTLL